MRNCPWYSSFIWVHIMADPGIYTDQTFLLTKKSLWYVYCIHWYNTQNFTKWCLPDYDVKVTINYRLGPLGFLSLGTPEYSGNMGLKDQALALKWVSDNIGGFNGDKNQITLYGSSAGAVSANLHMISPATKHLFQRVILTSGCGLNPWAYTKHNHIRILRTFGKFIFSTKKFSLDWILNISTSQFKLPWFRIRCTPSTKWSIYCMKSMQQFCPKKHSKM